MNISCKYCLFDINVTYCKCKKYNSVLFLWIDCIDLAKLSLIFQLYLFCCILGIHFLDSDLQIVILLDWNHFQNHFNIVSQICDDTDITITMGVSGGTEIQHAQNTLQTQSGTLIILKASWM